MREAFDCWRGSSFSLGVVDKKKVGRRREEERRVRGGGGGGRTSTRGKKKIRELAVVDERV